MGTRPFIFIISPNLTRTTQETRFMIHTYRRGNRLREVRYLVHECTARLESRLSDSQGWAPNQALEFHGHPPTSTPQSNTTPGSLVLLAADPAMSLRAQASVSQTSLDPRAQALTLPPHPALPQAGSCQSQYTPAKNK